MSLMKFTSVFEKTAFAYKSGKHVIAHKGSTRSSKTISVLQLLYLIAAQSEKSLLISIVSESFPHLNRGCIRDFENILKNNGIWDVGEWNATNKIYKVGNSKIEFFSADTASKVHGPSRDILYINECINVPYEIYRQLAIRTTETIFLDCNPCFEFWLDEKVLPRDDAVLIHSTYKDNRFLSEAQIREIESNKDDEDWWKVYGLGLTGSRVGLIMQNWDIITKIPDYALKGTRYIGIDFGFTSSPTAISDCYVSDGELWLNELLYKTNVSNLAIADFLSESGIPRHTQIIADSAEPKSIAELQAAGWSVEPANKSPNSVIKGIEIINRYKKHITADSLNAIKEFRNYRWKTDIDGKATNEPIKKWDHYIDSVRYVCYNKLGRDGNIFGTDNLKWV